jgi:predicted chitinase
MPWVKTAYWRKDKNGHSWLGRGYPQCTHRVNYEKCEKATGHPFTAQPHLMLEATPAIQAMFSMMQSGGYTGKSLAHYFNSKANDPHNARRIINATESADKIKGYYTTILNALTKASKG